MLRHNLLKKNYVEHLTAATYPASAIFQEELLFGLQKKNPGTTVSFRDMNHRQRVL